MRKSVEIIADALSLIKGLRVEQGENLAKKHLLRLIKNAQMQGARNPEE
jgi:hypothetical protein